MKALALSIALLSGVAAHAVVLWDNSASTTSYTNRGAGGSMPAGRWTNTNGTAIALSSVAFVANFSVVSDVKYVLADGLGNVLDTVEVTHSGSGVGLYSANVNWTVGAGETFMIASMVEEGARIGYSQDYALQNGIQGLTNGNFSNYGNPSFDGTAGASMSWVLSGEPVPEPGTMAVLGLGLAAAARRRRKA